MKKRIVGRVAEKKALQEAYDSQESGFLAVTGRRRVGKTYLVRSFFGGRISFDFSGILNASYRQQLQNFFLSLQEHFPVGKKETVPSTWLEAFHRLSRHLDNLKTKRKKVIFIDELPWLDTHRSHFMAALEWFWNQWAAKRKVLLVVCGSATSWIIHHLINNRGGLHNRITGRIHLRPFSLGEAHQYLRSLNVKLSGYQVALLYMALGGIPHYLKEVRPGESAMQAVNRICFQKNGLLAGEFENLYKALFKNPGNHEKIIRALSGKARGLTRDELLKVTRLNDGGTFTTLLNELEWCDFIGSVRPFGKKKKETLYRLQDEFSVFFLKFMEPKKSVNWQQLATTQAWKSWSGFAFENLCLKHAEQIKNKLGIAGIYSEISGYYHRGKGAGPGTQIDLLIDRSDGVINICEAKFYDRQFALSRAYAKELQQKINIFRARTGTPKAIFITLITAFGVAPGENSTGLVQSEVTLEDLVGE